MGENLACTITFRLPVSLYEEIEKEVGKGKIFKNLNEASRSLVSNGLRMLALQKIARDPEKRKEFEEKLNLAFNEKTREEALQTMDVDELQALIFKASRIKDSKVQQLILEQAP